MSAFILILTWHCDPGHEWLEVPAPLVDRLQILNDISEYSYYSHDKGQYFLEGDCDAAVLIDALRLNGIEFVTRFKSYNRDASIRRMARVGSAE